MTADVYGKMRVATIDKDTSARIVCAKHYSRSLGIFWEGFGLFDGTKIVGVCCYGQPSASIQKYAFKDRDFRLYELTRLVIDAGVVNGASMLIGRSLKMLKESPNAVISYADSAHGHCGIVYQATNWLYTGEVTAHDSLYLVDGVATHPMTIRDKFGVTEPARWAREKGYQQVKPQGKQRYFFFNGNKSQRRVMMGKLNYPVITDYPKRDRTMYDSAMPCSHYISTGDASQGDLFA